LNLKSFLIGSTLGEISGAQNALRRQSNLTGRPGLVMLHVCFFPEKLNTQHASNRK
jgi:hypothetical protein